MSKEVYDYYIGVDRQLTPHKFKSRPYLVIDDECKYDIDKHISDEHLINTPFSTGFNADKLKEAIIKSKALLK